MSEGIKQYDYGVPLVIEIEDEDENPLETSDITKVEIVCKLNDIVTVIEGNFLTKPVDDEGVEIPSSPSYAKFTIPKGMLDDIGLMKIEFSAYAGSVSRFTTVKNISIQIYESVRGEASE